MTADHEVSPGGPLDDDALGRLLADGLQRGARRSVDGDLLVAGATAGARRIRRRRSALAGAAALVLVGSGAAWITQGSTETVTGSSASASKLAEAAPAPAVAGDARGPAGTDAAGSVPAGSGAAGPVPPGTATPLAVTVPPPGAAQAPRPSGGGPAAVPETALLQHEDVGSSLMGPFVSTTADDGTAPALTPADVCGTPLPAPPPQAGARGVDLRGRVTVVSVVRVLPGDGAGSYAAALLAQPCLRRTSGAFDEGASGHGPADAQGQVRWFAFARSGRTLVEVRVVVPAGNGTGAAEVATLLSAAVRRDAAFAGQAAADPALD